jgi:hypothetical protein
MHQTETGRKPAIERRRGRRRFNGRLQLVGAAFLLFAGAIHAQQRAQEVEAARSAIEQWMEIQRVIALERRDLVLAREMLNGRIELVQGEIDSLRGKIEEAKGELTAADEKWLESVAENERLGATSTRFKEALIALEVRVKQLVPRLPELLQERVKPLSRRLPESPEESKAAPIERYQNVVGILNEANKFNRQIHVTSEIRTLPDGSAVEVAALYVGVGRGFYVGADGVIAGVGSATEEGWIWKPANEAAEPIARAIAILKNERTASFVRLPIEIR